MLGKCVKICEKNVARILCTVESAISWCEMGLAQFSTFILFLIPQKKKKFLCY